MTRQEMMDYRCRCPYDAMGDYTVFLEEEEGCVEGQGQERVSALGQIRDGNGTVLRRAGY